MTRDSNRVNRKKLAIFRDLAASARDVIRVEWRFIAWGGAMPIVFSCSCQKKLRAPDSTAGKKVKCPACGTVLTIPEPPSPPDTFSIEQESAEPPKAAETYEPEPEPPKQESTPAPKIKRQRRIPEPAPVRSWRDSTYFILVLALIPLGLMLFLKKDDAADRLVRTLEKLPKGGQARVDNLDEEEVFKMLPDGRIEGAHLGRTSYRHYLYGLVAAGAFFLLGVFLVRPEDSHPWSILLSGVFTGTAGIVILLLAQLFAAVTQGYILVSTNPVIMVIFWAAWAIGFSYSVASNPDYGFLATFFGFTFGVGFCEEVCKALPLMVYYRGRRTPRWHDGCAIGYASGAGFGIAEALLYAGHQYNGIATYDVYLVRFISCVALHVIWSLSTALFLHKHQWLLHDAESGYEYIPRVMVVVAIPMILHGLYDSALQKDMGWAALVAALASFAWLAWLMETARGSDEEPVRKKRRIRMKTAQELA